MTTKPQTTDFEEVALDINDKEQKDDTKSSEEKEATIPDKGGLRRLHSEFGSSFTCTYFLGVLSALCNGTSMVIFAIAFEQVLDILGRWYTKKQEGENVNVNKAALECLLYFIGMGVGAFVFTILQYHFFGAYASKTGALVRRKYFKALLNQDMTFHDNQTSGKLNSQLISDCSTIEEGLGTKMGFLFQQLGSFISGTIVAFYYSWRLTLILVACVPVIGIIGYLQGLAISGADDPKSDPFADNASSLTQEVFTNIRIVVSFPNIVKSKIIEYGEILKTLYPKARKKQYAVGLGVGLFMGGILGIMYPVSLYFGSGMIDDGKLTVGDLFGSYFAFFIAAMGLGQIGSVAGDIKDANTSANKLFNLLERKPKIKKSEGTELNNVEISGDIEFRSVSFTYDDKQVVKNPNLVLNNVSFKVKSGQSVALVGPSGSGKSTVIKLIERFYDPFSGEILVDNHPIHNYNLNNLRQQIGLVSQMPLLFNDTVFNNIKGGNDNVSDEDIKLAAKKANAHDFIQSLADKYETNVGELGNKLSGGQKQRVAIARTLLNKPKILLLDEATSALDSKSEKLIQECVDNIQGVTKLIIAHRLSTIKNCDLIIVLVDGEIVERGNHHQLLNKNGVYSVLVKSQSLLEKKHLEHLSDRQHSEENLLSNLSNQDLKDIYNNANEVEEINGTSTHEYNENGGEVEGEGENTLS